MHLRKLVLACGFASLTLSNYVSALGLGEVKLKSTLNQPLSAEVQLLDTKGLTPEQIIVALASNADFERNGVELVHFYTEFQFQVLLDNPSGPIVKITSRNPVREPYLNFLVEAKWTSGRLLREYTLLMDLPTFDEKPAQSVQAPEAAKPTVKQSALAEAPKVAQPQAESVSNESAAQQVEEKPAIIAEQDQPAKKSKVSSGTYGPVGDRETLWDIALSVRPDSSASVHQTMLALQRLNPDAFIHGNINLLKKGQVLRLPDEAEVKSVSKSEAVAQFNAQIGQTSTSTASNESSALGAQLDASKHTNVERRKDEPASGRVKLEAPASKEKGANGQGSGSNKGSGKALESELASTLEELDKAKSEKTELSSRVHDLEEQVKTMQRLVDVSNEKLRAMQLSAAKQNEKPVDVKAPETKVSSAAPVSSAKEVSSAAQSSKAGEPVSAVESSAAPVAHQEKKPEPVKKPAAKLPPKPAPEPSLVDQLMDNIAVVGAGALGIVGLAGFAVWRRRKSQEAAESAPEFTATEPQFDEVPNFAAFNEAQFEHPDEDVHLEQSSPSFKEEDTSAEAETGDVVSEAEIYIALGNYDTAEDMLLNGLKKDPASSDIRIKLMELYAQTQNAPEFDKHYAALLPVATGFLLSRAGELRASIPGIGEFEGDLSPSASLSEPSSEEFDIDDDFTLDDLQPVATTPVEDELSFDLDLDDELAANSELDAGIAGSSDELDLDLDLDGAFAEGAVGEDLSDISSALDSLEDDGLPEDIELAAKEDEFSFDFNELESDSASLAEEVENVKAPQLDIEQDEVDDFNFDVDVDSAELASLDSEMADLDADFAALDSDALHQAAETFGEDSDSTELSDLDVSSSENGILAIDDDVLALDEVDDGQSDLNEFDVELDNAEAFESAEFAALDDDNASIMSSEADLVAVDDEPLDWESEEDSALLEDDELLSLDDDLEIEEDFDIDSEPSLPAEETFDALADEAELDGLTDEDLDLDLETLDVELDVADALDNSIESLADTLDDSGVETLAVDELQSDEVDFAAGHLDSSTEVAFAEEAAPFVADDNPIEEEDIFEQAMSDFSAENLALDEQMDLSDDDLDAELDFMADADEAATKLDLARAYIDMGDNDGARDILAEVAHEGNDEQRQEAVDLLSRIDV